MSEDNRLPSLPWRLHWEDQQLRLLSADDEEITEWTYAIRIWGERYEEAKAECDTEAPEYIVRVCNLFPELVAALEHLHQLLDDDHMCSVKNWMGFDITSDVRKRIEATLATARAES